MSDSPAPQAATVVSEQIRDCSRGKLKPGERLVEGQAFGRTGYRACGARGVEQLSAEGWWCGSRRGAVATVAEITPDRHGRAVDGAGAASRA